MQAALTAANRIAVDLTTYTYQDINAHYAKLEAEGTTLFKQTLEAHRADAVAFDQQVKAISQGQVIDSAAKPPAADGTITVLLFVDQELRRQGAKVGQLERVRVSLGMKNVDGTWLANTGTVTGSS